MPQNKNSMILLKILAVINNFWNIGGHTLKKRTNYYCVRVKNKKQIGGNKMLEVGQKVRVKSSIEVGKRYDETCLFRREMEQFKGRVFEIKESTSPNRYKLQGAGTWSYTEEMLTTIESEADTMALKVGDRVKVTEVLGMDSDVGIELGNIYTVSKVDYIGDIYIKAPEDDARFMSKSQIEKVEETVKMTEEIKKGDKVEVIALYHPDSERGMSLGDVFEIESIDYDGDFRINFDGNSRYVMRPAQVKKVEGKMTFAEMTEKLLAGEFEVGTELIADGFKSFYVDKALGGYGLAESKTAMIVSATINAGLMNGTWVVKEPEPTVEPVKEMSIEDLQKELGYKVKIVE